MWRVSFFFILGAVACGGNSLRHLPDGGEPSDGPNADAPPDAPPVPPDTAITQQPPALTGDTTAQFAFTSTVANSTFECQLDSAAFAACATPDSLTGLGSGSHTFAVRATDPAGLTDATPASYTWTVDLSIPDTVIDSGPTGSVQATTATFAFHAVDAGSGAATFTCAVDGATPTACTSPTTYTSMSEAQHTFAVAATSSLGIVDPTPAMQVWIVDHTPPTVTITGGPTGPTNVKTPSFPFTTAGDPTQIQCTVDGGTYTTCTSPYTTASLADGAHTVTVRVTDAAGNQGSDSRSFTVDTVPPTVAIDTHPANPTNATSATFTFHSPSDANATYLCAIAGTFSACTSAQTYTGLSGAGQTGTSHTFQVEAIDLAGNTSAPVSYTWTIDTTAPTTTITAHPVNPSASLSASFSFTANETSTFTCKLDSGTATACNGGTASYTVSNASHTFSVFATDTAGNAGTAATYTWVANNNAPTITQVPPTGWTVNYFPFAFSGPIAGVTYQCSINGGAYATCASPNTVTGASYATANTFAVRWIDGASNASSSATATWTPKQGLVLYYPFNGDLKNRSILSDFYAYDGTGTSTFTGGYAGGAVTPGGAITFANTVQPMTSATGYTISFWTNLSYPSVVGSYPQGGMLSTENTANPLGGCAIVNGIRGQMSVTCAGNPGGTISTVAIASTVNEWANVALTYASSGANVLVYVNGNLANTITNSNAASVFSTLQTNMVLGGTPPTTGLVPIDELRVYNESLTQAQLCAVLSGTVNANNICTPALPAEDFSLDNSLALNAGTWGDVATVTAGASTFDGTGEIGGSLNMTPPKTAAVTMADSTPVSATGHTLTFWFFDPGTNGVYAFTRESDWGLRVELSDGTLTLSGQGTGASGVVPFTGSTTYTLEDWHQVMIVDTDTPVVGAPEATTTELDIYIDGSFAKAVKLASAANVWDGTGTGNIQLGVLATSATPDVDIDEVKLWPYNLVTLTNASGQQEALCLLAFGGLFDEITGDCTFP